MNSPRIYSFLFSFSHIETANIMKYRLKISSEMVGVGMTVH